MFYNKGLMTEGIEGERDNMKVNEKNVNIIINRLEKLYEEAKCSLEFDNPLQLLIATQLAAQCTDKRVNIVTADLFEKYKCARDFADVDISELENDIKTTGFFRNKAKNISACCQMIIEKYNGKVPSCMEELLKLPGVGRKTANVVLGDAFGIPGIVVDTHAGRLARRMGMTDKEDPVKVEYDLMKIIPKEMWSGFCHRLVFFGRDCCTARKPKCKGCILEDICPKIGVNSIGEKVK